MKKLISTLIITTLSLTFSSVGQQDSDELAASGAVIVYDATKDFRVLDTGRVPYYIDEGNDSLGVDARIIAYRNMYARAVREFDGETGLYDVALTVITEEDGESMYRLMKNGKVIGTYRASYVGPGSSRDLKPETYTFPRIALRKGELIGIESMALTNGEIPEGNGTAWARGRWQQLSFALSQNQGPLRPSFNPKKDLLLAQFDTEDIYTIAALGSMLAHADFEKVQYFAVAGAVGRQTGEYINASSLLTLAFGAENTRWADAHNNRAEAVKAVTEKVQSVLAKHGHVWVQEAGPSDFTHDWISALISNGVDEKHIKNNVIVVQNSARNEAYSTPSKLEYVKTKTDYRVIEDGHNPKRKFIRHNRRGPVTPLYVEPSKKWLETATSNDNSKQHVRKLWVEAQKIVTSEIVAKEQDKSSESVIATGGIDISDAVASWWIFELNHRANSVHAFWDSYVTDAKLDFVNPPAGRLAVVADGNSPDPDDIGATPIMFALLQQASLNDRLVHVSHSCDLEPFSNKGKQQIDVSSEARRQQVLHDLSSESIEYFGPFENLRDYYNCRTHQRAATRDLVDAINASTAKDPLWIIEAGEPDLIGYALRAANPSAMQYVHVVSHHPANDNSGDYFSWQQILDFGVTEHQIGDQNVGLQTPVTEWDWAKDHQNPGIAFIWDMLAYAERDGIVDFQTNKFDCSDAGMMYWWITGANEGGNNNATPRDVKRLLPK
ncbi:hypothetical protein [Echinimonas agarilytica]|uniref:Uncharacterized protein n=1 Tax=Echinimonas agarilytica TaxID=1215918 RepID=A0AA42B8K3_9GAMM|nr:hypothetical protein [Echinimonas agarilytica]MCM2680678.1 hypothetical protein [Echinimonas agarilytica]